MHWEGEQITSPDLLTFLIMHCSEGQLCRLGAVWGLDLLSVTHAITHIITITCWHSRTPKDCAIDTPVVPSIPSSVSSASAPPPQSCSAQRDPANHLLPFHAALVVDRQDERDVGELEQSYLEHKGLLVGGVGLASANGRLALGHLLTHWVQ